MSEEDTFERILASLHDAALDPVRWPSTAALIDEALGTHGNTLVFGDGDSEDDLRVYFAWICWRGERHPELERMYFETLYPHDERMPRIRRAPFGRLFPTTDFYTEEELKSSAAYHALRNVGNAGNAINVRLTGPDDSRIFWEVNDPVDGKDWSSAQLGTIRRLLPHIRHFVHVQQTLSSAGALGKTLTELLDASGVGVIQLNARGRILEMNDRARDLLRSGDTLYDEGGSLLARSPHDNAELEGLLGRAVPPFWRQGEGGSMIVRRAAPLPPLVVHVNPVRWRETDLGAWPVAALVLVVDPASGQGVDPEVVARTLGFTAMESRVAVLIAEGMNAREVAAAMGRTENTIRSHLKSIYVKHRLTRQSELARLVLSLAGAAGRSTLRTESPLSAPTRLPSPSFSRDGRERPRSSPTSGIPGMAHWSYLLSKGDRP